MAGHPGIMAHAARADYGARRAGRQGRTLKPSLVTLPL
jgi:hypothetical protein